MKSKLSITLLLSLLLVACNRSMRQQHSTATILAGTTDVAPIDGYKHRWLIRTPDGAVYETRLDSVNGKETARIQIFKANVTPPTESKPLPPPSDEK